MTARGGYTLVEVIVAVALFSVVMLVSVSALLSLVKANRKAQAIQMVMNNLNIAVDGMVRSAREGTIFHGTNGSGCTNLEYTVTADCVSGGTRFSFRPRGDGTPPIWIYDYDSTTKRLRKSVTGNITNLIPITASEITIDYMRFYVVGTATGDTTQSKVIIVIKGSAGVEGTSARTTFHLQATAVQRVLDL